jgi:hypothetical protein
MTLRLVFRGEGLKCSIRAGRRWRVYVGRAYVGPNDKRIHVGYFDEIEPAFIAWYIVKKTLQRELAPSAPQIGGADLTSALPTGTMPGPPMSPY